MPSLFLEREGAVLDRLTIVLDGTRLYTTGSGRKKRTLAGVWCHPSLNDWASRGSRFVSQDDKNQWVDGMLRRTRGLEGIRGPVVVTVTTYFPKPRRRDIDNYSPKFILDGLVAGGLIDGDDSETVVDLRTRLRVDERNPRTEILVERSGEQGLVQFVQPVQPMLDGLALDPVVSGLGRAGRSPAGVRLDARKRKAPPSVPGSSSGVSSRTRGPRT
jgi:Holliday junction resolvase RusA-like endonuclease